MSTTGQRSFAPAARVFRRERTLVGLLCTALAGAVLFHTLTQPLPKTLIVAAPRQTRMTAGQGPENELLKRFEDKYGVTVELVLTDTPEEAVDMVENGRAHVGLAIGVAPLDNATDALQRRGKDVAYGPLYDTQPIYAVDWETSENEPLALPNPPSPALDELLRVARSFSQDPLLAPALPLDALLLLIPFLPEVRDTAPTGLSAATRFLWRTDVPQLDKTMREFWAHMKDSGTLAAMRERTMGYLPVDPDPVEMELLRRTLVSNATPLAPVIRKASHRFKLDPFLLMAVIHQESHFNPNAVSPTGVRGLMQLTNATLEFLEVQNPEDHAEVISAGARYLAGLRSDFLEMGYGPDDAQWLALASFNVGQGHVQDAIDLARAGGLTRPGWLSVRSVLPTLNRLEVAQQTKYGLCRGFEAVDFVDKVRYFSYAIKGLVFSSGAQGDELAGLHLSLAR